MKSTQTKIQLTVIVALAGLMAACGAKTTDTANLNQQAPSTPTPTPTPSPTYSGNLPAPIYFDADLTGPGTPPPGMTSHPVFTTTTPIVTDTLFRVHIVALSNVELYNQGNNFGYNMSCAQYTVTVNGHARSTGILNAGGPYTSALCGNAPTSATLDFSADVAGAGSAGSLIQISGAQNDWKCISGFGQAYCPISSAYWNHRVHVRACVQTDGHADCQ